MISRKHGGKHPGIQNNQYNYQYKIGLILNISLTSHPSNCQKQK